MRFIRPWSIVRRLFKEAVFRLPTSEKVCCLTFDDGPDPETTPVLLDILDRHNVKAMFFCTGKAAREFPSLVSEIEKRGHMVGNHGYNHYDGWKTPAGKYLDDIRHGSEFTSRKYFRPPYGRLTFGQYRQIIKSYKVFMWDIMPYDFDKERDPAEILEVLKKKLRSGSVVVLHDKPGIAPDVAERFIQQTLSEGFRLVLPGEFIV